MLHHRRSVIAVTKNKQDYWVALDGLRAIAVFLVIIHHLGSLDSKPSVIVNAINKLASWGWVGVDCFFVLSGFLITSLLLREKTLTQTISIKGFYWRRILRIWPLYFLILFIAFTMVPLWAPNPASLKQWSDFLFRDGLPFALFAGNYCIILDWKSLYSFDRLLGFESPLVCCLLMPLWSLAVEEQFYLFWPVILRAVDDRTKLIKTTIGIGLFSALSLLLCAVRLPTGTDEPAHQWYYLNTLCRLLPIMAGALVALINHYSPHRLQIFRTFGMQSFATGVFIFILLLLFFPPIKEVSAIHILTMVLISTCSTIFLVLSLNWPPLTLVLSTKILTYLGRRSYAIYLFHSPSLYFAKQAVCPILGVRNSTTEWLVTAGFGIPLTLLLAESSWHLIERRFLELREEQKGNSAPSLSAEEKEKEVAVDTKQDSQALTR